MPTLNWNLFFFFLMHGILKAMEVKRTQHRNNHEVRWIMFSLVGQKNQAEQLHILFLFNVSSTSHCFSHHDCWSQVLLAFLAYSHENTTAISIWKKKKKSARTQCRSWIHKRRSWYPPCCSTRLPKKSVQVFKNKALQLKSH